MPCKRKTKTEEHIFYCLNCGNRYSLQRRVSLQSERFHRKKLYCYNCRKIINHIECKNYNDALTFKENFIKGNYIQEAKDSMEYIKKGDDLFARVL